MEASIFDILIDFVLRLDLFANYNEVHATETGLFIPILCLAISRYDERISGIVFGCAVLTGLGIVPILSHNSVVATKPWYFLGGMVFSSFFISISNVMYRRQGKEYFSQMTRSE